MRYILQPIADVLSEAEGFRKCIDVYRQHNLDKRIRNVKWTHSTSTDSSIAYSGLELTFSPSLHSQKTGDVEFLDVIHCITGEDDLGFVTKDFVNQQRKEGSSITGNNTTLRRLI